MIEDKTNQETPKKRSKNVVTEVAEKLLENAVEKPVDYPKLAFKLVKIVYENTVWKLVLDLEATLPRVYMRYFINFVPNESNFDLSVQNENENIQNKKDDAQSDMFEINKSEIEKHKNRIKEIEKSRMQFLAENPVVESLAHVVELKNQITTTRVTFIVPATLIDFLNAKRIMLSDHYEVQLKLLDSELSNA